MVHCAVSRGRRGAQLRSRTRTHLSDPHPGGAHRPYRDALPNWNRNVAREPAPGRRSAADPGRAAVDHRRGHLALRYSRRLGDGAASAIIARPLSTTEITMFDLKAIQPGLRDLNDYARLLYDCRGSNPLARRVLGLDEKAINSRRFFYLIPAQGEPRKLLHRIETFVLDTLPGDKVVYLRWQELEKGIKELVSPFKRVAMEYSPKTAIP